ncbi:hypothetical protein ACROYT_G041868 [Oculina patagonica]
MILSEKSGLRSTKDYRGMVLFSK